MSIQQFQQAVETRRSRYALNSRLPIGEEAVKQIVEHAVQYVPSSFNSQSTRLLVLFGAEHRKLWDAAAGLLRAIVGDAEKFQSTQAKLDSFKAGAGTVLFFEDQTVIEGLQAQFPQYAENFPVWGEHANAMHQFVIWTALSEAQIGASLQHYNPVIDEFVAAEWQIPASWKLRAQLVFGGIEASAGEKTFLPLEPRIRYAGSL